MGRPRSGQGVLEPFETQGSAQGVLEPFETQGSDLEGRCAGGEVGLLSEKTVWWQCVAGTTVCSPVARDVLALCCNRVTSASAQCRCTWSFAECVWLLLEPQGFMCG